jgi:deoxyribonuclease-4
MILGAHVSTQGGLEKAFSAGLAIGADAVQIFTRNQVQWAHRPISEEEAASFQAAREATGLKYALSHGSYLVNLASPVKSILKRSRGAFLAELERCRALGIPYLVFHPGAHMGKGMDAGLETLVASLGEALAATAGSPVVPLLEVTAGQGSYIGSRFEELAHVLEKTPGGERLGICLDTCHLYAAGYDIRTPQGLSETLDALESTVGPGRLKAVHVNDSQKGLGSKLDRHAPIGEGALGTGFFEALVREPRLGEIPLVLETPGSEEAWKEEIRLLRRFGTA